MEIGEMSGIKLVLSNEDYVAYKKTLQEQLEDANQEIERLQNIIKEVREYIEEKNKYNSKPPFLMSGETKKLLEILDKENI